MENEETYAEAKKKAKLFYKTIGRVWCPALGDFVIFNKAGFQHLIQKGRMPRIKSEQRRRFEILPYVKEILRISLSSATEEKIVNQTHIRYWKLIDYRNELKISISIVVRQVEDKSKHFFSIYAKKQKSAPKSADS